MIGKDIIHVPYNHSDNVTDINFFYDKKSKEFVIQKYYNSKQNETISLNRNEIINIYNNIVDYVEWNQIDNEIEIIDWRDNIVDFLGVAYSSNSDFKLLFKVSTQNPDGYIIMLKQLQTGKKEWIPYEFKDLRGDNNHREVILKNFEFEKSIDLSFFIEIKDVFNRIIQSGKVCVSIDFENDDIEVHIEGDESDINDFSNFEYAYEDFENILIVNSDIGIRITFGGFLKTLEGVKAVFGCENSSYDKYKLYLDELYVNEKNIGDNLFVGDVIANHMNSFCTIVLDKVFFNWWEYEIFFKIRLKDENENTILVSKEIHILFSNGEKKLEVLLENPSNETQLIEFHRFLVYSKNLICHSKAHNTTSINAYVEISTSYGVEKSIRFPAIWCENCNAYFISDEIYRRLKSEGTILCKVCSADSFENRNILFDGYNAQSTLNLYGYNVNAKENKSDKERRAILDYLIKYEVMTKEEIVSFIKYLIERPSGNRNMSQSIKKWRSDLEYLTGKKTQIQPNRIITEKEDAPTFSLEDIFKDDMPF